MQMNCSSSNWKCVFNINSTFCASVFAFAKTTIHGHSILFSIYIIKTTKKHSISRYNRFNVSKRQFHSCRKKIVKINANLIHVQWHTHKPYYITNTDCYDNYITKQYKRLLYEFVLPVCYSTKVVYKLSLIYAVTYLDNI